MSGAIISVETKTEKEANNQLDAHKRQAIRMGLMHQRSRHVGYDDNDHIWRGYLWMHTMPFGIRPEPYDVMRDNEATEQTDELLPKV